MLIGLELMCMGLMWSKSGLFRPPGVIVSPVGKRARRKKKKKKNGKGKEGEREYERKGRKEEGIIDWGKDKKKGF